MDKGQCKVIRNKAGKHGLAEEFLNTRDGAERRKVMKKQKTLKISVKCGDGCRSDSDSSACGSGGK